MAGVVTGLITLAAGAMVVVGAVTMVLSLVSDAATDSNPGLVVVVLVFIFGIPTFFGYQVTRYLLQDDGPDEHGGT